jgi:ABC-type nitrate/sulfonate/bicarbonate transport system permease component
MITESRFRRDVLPPAIFILGALLIWHGAVIVGSLPAFILPTPLDVIATGWEQRARLGQAILDTMIGTAIGLSISILLGIAFAALMDLSGFLRRAFYPILVASQTIQILAIAPLLIIWFDFGLTPKIITIVLICFFPMAVATTDGLASSDPDQVALLKVMGASRWQTWRMVRLPSALPSFFSGLKLAVTYSVVGATIGEWVGGSEGLGLYLLRSKNALATDQVFAAMLITTLLSIGLFLLVTLAERIAMPWYFVPSRRGDWEK